MKKQHLLFIILIFSLTGIYSCSNTPTPQEIPTDTSYPTLGSIERLHPDLDKILPPNAIIEVLGEGFDWSEGPVWVPKGKYLLFSDIPPNKIMKWKEGEGVSLYLTPSGYTGEGNYSGEPGSNGLLLDAKGRLILCQHGDRRIARMDAPMNDPKPVFTSLAEYWEDKRFNSPNDAVLHSSGAIYFTDPPYGLPDQAGDKSRENKYCGVYRLNPDGHVELLEETLSRPNGIALSPDEKTLYVANSYPRKAIWMAYDIDKNGKLTGSKVLYDATSEAKLEKGLPDGLKVDKKGNIFATGPGGVWIFNSQGTILGKIRTGQATSNCALGNRGKELYITADMYLLRVKFN